MTDPDTIAAFNALRAARDTTPEAEPLPATPDHLSLPPTDAEIFDGVPAALPEDITEKIVRSNGNDDDWEDEKTAVREVPQFRKPHDPTGCMM